MSSAWGNTWGASWASSWDASADAPEPDVPVVAQGGGGSRWNDYIREEKKRRLRGERKTLEQEHPEGELPPPPEPIYAGQEMSAAEIAALFTRSVPRNTEPHDDEEDAELLLLSL